jgi:pimeloyl-ACP methyl ester carboxylesterase
VTAATRSRLYHEIAGAGSPVFFVHSGLCDGRMWDPQWDVFRRDYRLVRCDLPGHGRTPLEAGRYSPPREVIDLLDQLALGPVALVGASLGGGISLQVAVARPDLVSALVLVGSGVRGHEWSEHVTRGWEEEEAALERGDIDAAVEGNLRTWVDGPHRSPDEVDPGVRARVAEMQRRAFELALAEPDAEERPLVSDVGERLAEIGAPTLVIVGEKDVPDVHAVAERLTHEIPNARVARIPQAAHLPSLERPDEFNELVLRFLAEQT